MYSARSEIGSQEVLRLSEKELSYLKGNGSGKYSEKELDRRIEEKCDKLPERFEILFDDIEALYQPQYNYDDVEASHREEFIAEEVAEETEIIDEMELTKNFLRVSGSDIKLPISKQEFHHLYEWGEYHQPRPHRLGFRLGHMVSHLMVYSEETDTVDSDADVVLGFLEGLRTGNLPMGDVDGEKVMEEVEKLLSRIKKRAKKSTEVSDKRDERMLEQLSQETPWQKARSKVWDVLGERGLRKTSEEQFREMFKEDKEPVDIDLLPQYTTGDTELVMEFLEQEYGRHYTTNNSEEERIVTKEEIHAVFEKYDLENKIAFWRNVHGDKKKTRETSWSRGSARDVLRVFKGGTATKTEVARELSDNSLGNVPQAEHVILPQLSGESDISPWDERPLIMSEEDNWKLTAYGRLLRYLIFEHTGWESVRNIPEELVDDAQSEIEF